MIAATNQLASFRAAELVEHSATFREAVLAIPDRVGQFIETIDDAEAAGVALGDMEAVLESCRRRLKDDVQAINAIQYGKLLIAAKVGELLPRQQGKRSDKETSEPEVRKFSEKAVAKFRKIADHKGALDEYRRQVEAANEDGAEPVEMGLQPFIRFTTTGTLKPDPKPKDEQFADLSEAIDGTHAAIERLIKRWPKHLLPALGNFLADKSKDVLEGVYDDC